MGSSEGGRSPSAVSMAEVIRRWRLQEFAGLAVALIAVSLIEACFSEYEQFVPENNKEGVNGFPVRLGFERCTASDLSTCQTQPGTGCCRAMHADEKPFETVDELQLMVIYFGVPAAFILLRHILVKSGQYRGAASLADVILGVLFCLGVSVTVTDGIKLMVGRPRPNYAALRALVEFGGKEMSSFKGKSIRSFPSGHSSMSMAGTLYVTLVCWGDLSRFASDQKSWRRSLLAYLSVLPAFISIWVGVSRIRDYWHFQDDVLAGWVIGAVSASLAVRWVTFSEAFWRGAGGGDDRLGASVLGSGNLQSLRENSGFQLMTGSQNGSDVAVGDDDTGSDVGPDTPYGDALQAAAEGKVAVTVSGVPGQRTAGMVQRMNDELDGVPHGSYPIAVLLGGTNDLGYGCSVDEVVDNLSLLVEGMLSRRSRLVVLLGIPQHHAMYYYRNGVIARKRKQINDRLREMCGDGNDDLLYVDLDSVVPYFEEDSEVPSAASSHLWDDGLHFSAEGYAAIGVCVFNAISAYLQPP
eukprot:g19189.t1